MDIGSELIPASPKKDMSTSADKLFALLRLALDTSSGEAVDQSALTKADWEALVDLAFEQGVAAIAVNGIDKPTKTKTKTKTVGGCRLRGLRACY